MSSIFDLPGFDEFMNDYMKDGTDIGGDLIYWYDEDHKKKVLELLDRDARYYYYIQIRCGVNPDDDSRYGPDTDLRIVNVDHFAIRKSVESQVEKFRKIVYDAIDYVYSNRDQIDLDYEVWDEDGEYGDGYIEFLDSIDEN